MFRPAYLAGQWYPDDASTCAKAIEAHARDAKVERAPWRVLIAPHAGWTYSGDAAAQGYRWLAEAQPDTDLVVIFGMHRGPEGPNTIFRGAGWETPLGVIRNAQSLADELALQLRLRNEPVQPTLPDNAVELHLPFIRFFFPKAELLMLGVSAAMEAIEIGAAVGQLVKQRKRQAVFVGSTDLTHYGPNYEFEPVGHGERAVDWVRRENDQGFIDLVLKDDARGALVHGLEHASACCPGAVAAALAAADAYGRSKEARLVSHYLSYDVMPNSSFVGYAGIVL